MPTALLSSATTPTLALLARKYKTDVQDTTDTDQPWIVKAFANTTQPQAQQQQPTTPAYCDHLLQHTDAATLKHAVLEADVVVLDCLNQIDLAESILAAIADTKELETPTTLIALSSALTWARTSTDADEPDTPLTEIEYKRRRPHSQFKQLLAVEKLVTRAKRPNLRTHVVAAGVVYGSGEDVLHPLFKSAWLGQSVPLISLEGSGANELPTIHVADLVSALEALHEHEDAPAYLLAVDGGQQHSEDEPQTLAAVTRAIAEQLGSGETHSLAQPDVVTQRDYPFFQLGVKLAPAAINDLGFEWHCEEGLLAGMGLVVDEYRASRGLQPLRVLVHGNDAPAVSTLASALAAEYELTHVKATDHPEAAADEAALAKALAKALTTLACKNQGYVLEGFPTNLAQATALFSGGDDDEGGGGGGGDDDEGEEGTEPPAVPVPPEFVLLLEAEPELIKERPLPTGTTAEALAAELDAYAAHFADGSETSLLKLPALAEIEALNLPTDAEGAADANLAKARIQLGPPRVYGPSEEELALKAALEEEERRAAEEAAEAAAAAAAAEAEADRQRRLELDERRRADVLQQERELTEVRAMPLRSYMLANVIPKLTEGLIEVCKVQPDDPVDYLANWLFKNAPADDD